MACLLNVETMTPEEHPIQAIKGIPGVVLLGMNDRFEGKCAGSGALARTSCVCSNLRPENARGVDGKMRHQNRLNAVRHEPSRRAVLAANAVRMRDFVGNNFWSVKRTVLQHPAKYSFATARPNTGLDSN